MWFKCGPVLPVLQSYLRNDSLLDMSNSSELYAQLFSLLRVLATSSEYVSLCDVTETGSLLNLLGKLNKKTSLMLSK